MSRKIKICLLIGVVMGVLVSFTNVVVTLVLGIAIAALALTSVGFLLSSLSLEEKPLWLD